MDVSKNMGKPPNHPFVHRVFHYKPSILGYQYFWKHPNKRLKKTHDNLQSMLWKHVPTGRVEKILDNWGWDGRPTGKEGMLTMGI